MVAPKWAANMIRFKRGAAAWVLPKKQKTRAAIARSRCAADGPMAVHNNSGPKMRLFLREIAVFDTSAPAGVREGREIGHVPKK